MEIYVTGTGQRVKVHYQENCIGTFCIVHNPSAHAMRDFPTFWREDRKLMERICPHGIGHPDPDDLSFHKGEVDRGIHGCDGCCEEGSRPHLIGVDPITEDAMVDANTEWEVMEDMGRQLA